MTGEPRAATCAARSDVVLYMIDQAAFRGRARGAAAARRGHLARPRVAAAEAALRRGRAVGRGPGAAGRRGLEPAARADPPVLPGAGLGAMTDPVCGQTVDPLRARAVASTRASATTSARRRIACSSRRRRRSTSPRIRRSRRSRPGNADVPSRSRHRPEAARSQDPVGEGGARPSAHSPSRSENDPTPLPRPVPSYSLADAPLGPPTPQLWIRPILPGAPCARRRHAHRPQAAAAPPSSRHRWHVRPRRRRPRAPGSRERARRRLDHHRSRHRDRHALLRRSISRPTPSSKRSPPRATRPPFAARPAPPDPVRGGAAPARPAPPCPRHEPLALGALPLGLLGGRIGGTTALLVACGALLDAIGAFVLAGPILARIVLARRRRALAAATALVSATLCFLAACLALRDPTAPAPRPRPSPSWPPPSSPSGSTSAPRAT